MTMNCCGYISSNDYVTTWRGHSLTSQLGLYCSSKLEVLCMLIGNMQPWRVEIEDALTVCVEINRNSPQISHLTIKVNFKAGK